MSETDKVFSGAIPDVYDEYLVPLIFEVFARDLAQRVAQQNPLTVLETATGSGVVTRALMPMLAPDARYWATDLNAPMLERAKRMQASDNRIAWQVADALALPFEDDSFDAACCQFGVMFFPDRVEGYREARRVLKPGGLFLLTDFYDLASLPRREDGMRAAGFEPDKDAGQAKCIAQYGQNAVPRDLPVRNVSIFAKKKRSPGLLLKTHFFNPGKRLVAGIADIGAEILAFDPEPNFSFGFRTRRIANRSKAIGDVECLAALCKSQTRRRVNSDILLVYSRYHCETLSQKQRFSPDFSGLLKVIRTLRLRRVTQVRACAAVQQF